jgi:hypothetical protein
MQTLNTDSGVTHAFALAFALITMHDRGLLIFKWIHARLMQLISWKRLGRSKKNPRSVGAKLRKVFIQKIQEIVHGENPRVV